MYRRTAVVNPQMTNIMELLLWEAGNPLPVFNCDLKQTGESTFDCIGINQIGLKSNTSYEIAVVDAVRQLGYSVPNDIVLGGTLLTRRVPGNLRSAFRVGDDGKVAG